MRIVHAHDDDDVDDTQAFTSSCLPFNVRPIVPHRGGICKYSLKSIAKGEGAMAEDASGIWILWEILSHPGVTDGIPPGGCPLRLRLAQGEEREKGKDRRVNPATGAPDAFSGFSPESSKSGERHPLITPFSLGKIGCGRPPRVKKSTKKGERH